MSAPEPASLSTLAPVFETIIVDTRTVACDGGGGGLGHPRVFLTIGPANVVQCPYCSRHYVLSDTPHHDHAHG